jgi:hypothetical protein
MILSPNVLTYLKNMHVQNMEVGGLAYAFETGIYAFA